MQHSGYEAVVDFLSNSRVIYAGDFAKLTRLSYPLRLAHILPRSYSSLDAELAALRSDGKILHHLYAEDTLWMSMFARFRGSRTVVATFHRPPHVLEATMPFFWKKKVRKLAGVIALSPRQREYLSSVCGSKTMASLIPHGIDTDYFTPGNSQRSGEVVLSVGSYQRDLTTLIKAMRMLSHDAPDLRLITITKKPLPRTRNIIPIANVSDEKLLAYYRKASFVVLPFGDLVASNAMLEAMACGMPVVCPRLESVRYYMGENLPTIYEPGDAEDLARKMLWLYQNEQERRKLSSLMRKRAELFSWARICALMREFYELLLSS
jgi:glycosyltransferase involved in cell wall biosynthesis